MLAIGALALIAGLVVGVGWLVDGRTGSTGVRDARIDAPDPDLIENLPDRRPAPTPERSASPVCTEGSSLGCFRWALEVPSVGWDQVAVGLGVVAYQEADGTLTGRDLSDAEILWTATGQVTAGNQLAVADDLLVHRDPAGLVGRDLRTGLERWRNPELPSLQIEAAQVQDELVLVSGVQDPTDSLIPTGHVIVALDVTTGELRWHRSGESAALAANGTGILLTEDDHLEAYGPDGQQRWSTSTTLERGAEYAWPRGHVVTVSDGRGEDRLHHLSDGALLERDGDPLSAWPMANDAEHTLLVRTDPVGDGGWMQTGDLVLVGEDGVLWHADEVLEPDGCFVDARLTADAVEVVRCGGGVLRLDLGDGSVTSPAEPSQVDGDDAYLLPGAWHLGSYQVRQDFSDDDDPEGSLVLWDTVRDTEVARLPADANPVFGYIDGSWTPDLGGVVVLQSTGWLTAIDLPEGDGSGAPDAGPDAG